MVIDEESAELCCCQCKRCNIVYSKSKSDALIDRILTALASGILNWAPVATEDIRFRNWQEQKMLDQGRRLSKKAMSCVNCSKQSWHFYRYHYGRPNSHQRAGQCWANSSHSLWREWYEGVFQSQHLNLKPGKRANDTTRIEQVAQAGVTDAKGVSNHLGTRLDKLYILDILRRMFLPAGYPNTVSPGAGCFIISTMNNWIECNDKITCSSLSSWKSRLSLFIVAFRYQVLNALQAFCTSLTGLLSSRAILQGDFTSCLLTAWTLFDLSNRLRSRGSFRNSNSSHAPHSFARCIWSSNQ
jgi:hypothetical protein